MIATKIPECIDQPQMPQNYYGMKMSISNVYPNDILFLGDNKNAERLKIKEIEFYENMWYLNVIDFNNRQFTIRYNVNSIVSLANSNLFPEQ